MEITKFIGLQNTTATERLKPGMLESARDVDIDSMGVLSSRLGQTLVSASATHSPFSTNGLFVVVQGLDMKRVDEGGSLTTLKRLTYGGRVAYAEVNGTVYFSNGVDTGRIFGGSVLEWGIRRPKSQPVATAGYGTLPPGRYLYAMTFLRWDGSESGSQVPALVELTAQGGIAFSGIESSSDPEVVGAVLYLSGPNGTELYRAGVAPAGTSTLSYGNDGLDLGSPLHPDPVFPAPPGTDVEVHAGVMYVADGDVAWASDQYNYERFRMGKRFLRLPGPITMLHSVSTGMYAATDRGTWFLEGTDPETMRARQVLEAGAVPGSVASVDGGERAAGGEGDIPSRPGAIWMSSHGVIFGDDLGQVTKVTQDNFGIPPAQLGAALRRVQGGNVTYVATLRGNAATGNQHP